MRSADFDVLSGVGNGLANLVVNPSRGEIRERAREGDFTPNGHARGYPHHVGLCYAHLKETIRKGFLKSAHFQGPRQVGAKPDDVVIGLTCLQQAFTKAAARVLGYLWGQGFDVA